MNVSYLCIEVSVLQLAALHVAHQRILFFFLMRSTSGDIQILLSILFVSSYACQNAQNILKIECKCHISISVNRAAKEATKV